MEREAVTQSQKERKASVEGTSENAVSGKQLYDVRKETHVVSVMIQRLESDAIRDERRTIVLSCTKSAGKD